MAITILKDSLLSRTARRAITSDRARRIATDLAFSTADDEPERGPIATVASGLINRVFRPLLGFTGWLIINLFRFAGFSATRIFQWLINGVAAIARFDWNQTDAEIRRLQQNNNLVLASVWGAFVGQGIGWLTGIGVGYGLAFICPVIGGGSLARIIAASVASEAFDELRFGLQAAAAQTARTLGSNVVLQQYLNLRKLLKLQPSSRLAALFGEQSADWIKTQWGAEGGPDLSFANQYEERIESISNDALRNFTEAVTEEFFDSFMEAGFIVAQEIDTAYAEAKRQAEANDEGPQRGLLLTPDREDPSEVLYLEGTEKSVKEQTLTVLNNHRLVYNRDIGQVVGQPAEDWYRGRPQRRKALVIFKALPGARWRDDSGRLTKTASYSIPDIKSGLTWREFKQWIRPYLWGEFRYTVNLDNGRQMAVYGASAIEAENCLERLLRFSTANVLTSSVSQEKRRNPKLRKYPTMMYPAHITLLIRTPSVDLNGRTDLSGNTWDEYKPRIPLWPDTEPPDLPVFR